MDLLKAKLEVIAAGERLVECGLIARTWGNVSCRVDEKSFVITPSGKPYIGLKPDDIVEVQIDDLSWDGDVKPSSEKGIHAEVYKMYSDANFVIHTHQKVASVVSALKEGISTLEGEAKKIIGSNVLLGGYGLPGTKKLRKGVTDALMLSPSKAVIMAHHGALCFGKDSNDAFEVAQLLENVCTDYIINGAKEKFSLVVDTLDDLTEKLLLKLTDGNKSVDIDKSEVYSSECDRSAGKITFTSDSGEVVRMDLTTGNTDKQSNESLKAHRDIYLANPDFRTIIHNTDNETIAVSALGKTMKPLLDDFSQICGTKVKIAKSYSKCAKAIKGKNAVLIDSTGALCCGKNLGDAQAVDMIMSKSCLTELGTKIFESAKPINKIEALLMRVIYLKKYSKQAE